MAVCTPCDTSLPPGTSTLVPLNRAYVELEKAIMAAKQDLVLFRRRTVKLDCEFAVDPEHVYDSDLQVTADDENVIVYWEWREKGDT